MGYMSATLRHTVIGQRRHRREKRIKLRGHLAKAAKAAPAERQAIQAKLDKTYAVVGAQSPEKQAVRKADKAADL